VDLLRHAIITGELGAGDQLKQDRLCSDFGISPGPVREALRQLESEGLVEHFPNRGVFVTDVSADEFLGVLMPVRTAIETYAVPLAAQRMSESAFQELENLVQRIKEEAERGDLGVINELDVRFHELTIEASGSGHALQLWRAVLPRIRAQIYRLSPRHRDLGEIATEHRRLLDALRLRDPEGIRIAVEHHIVGTANELLATSQETAHNERPANRAM
jgi:DNA-binding GntR family transcriptional regulator